MDVICNRCFGVTNTGLNEDMICKICELWDKKNNGDSSTTSTSKKDE